MSIGSIKYDMEHFYQSVPGWFDYPQLYDHAIELASDGAHFVEIGSWKGMSAAYMSVAIINSGKKIRFDCVDWWQGSDGVMDDPDVVNGTLYDAFIANISPVRDVITPVRKISWEAAGDYEDSSLDLVFIDAEHDYDSVSKDIRSWLPKVKPGGIISGHDVHHAPVRQAVDELVPGWEHWRSVWHHRV
jgi:hypothetical protein